MTTLFETLLTGSPIDIRTSVFKSLDEKAEESLKEEYKNVMVKIFTAPKTIKENVKRLPWNKQTIREALENAAVAQLQRDTLNENYSKIRHMHDVALQHGFVHESSYPGKGGHINHYTHQSGKHTLTINSPSQDYQLILGGGTHLTGNGHTDFKHHLKHLDEYNEETNPSPHDIATKHGYKLTDTSRYSEDGGHIGTMQNNYEHPKGQHLAIKDNGQYIHYSKPGVMRTGHISTLHSYLSQIHKGE